MTLLGYLRGTPASKLDTLLQQADVAGNWHNLNVLMRKLPAHRRSPAIYSFIGEATSSMRAKWFGAALVDAITEAPGAPKVRLWSQPTVGTRVYFRDAVGFMSVASDGSVSEKVRGQFTFLWSSLYPSEKQPLRQALGRYLAGSDDVRAEITEYQDALAAEISSRVGVSLEGLEPFGFELFAESEEALSPEESKRRIYGDLKRGGEVAVGGATYTIFASQGVVKLATRKGTKGTKMYVLRPTSNDGLELEVLEKDENGPRVGKGLFEVIS